MCIALWQWVNVMWLCAVILSVTQKVLVMNYLSTSHKINLLTWCFLCQQVIQHPSAKWSELPVSTVCKVWQAQTSKSHTVVLVVCLHSSVHSSLLFVAFIYCYGMILLGQLCIWAIKMRKMLQEWGRKQGFQILQVLHLQMQRCGCTVLMLAIHGYVNCLLRSDCPALRLSPGDLWQFFVGL